MSGETSACNDRDPRAVLVRDKYFSMRPQPLEQWLWRQGVPAAAERVFWVHWEAGQRARDWCSQIPIRVVASRCCIDPSTVTRAYQWLATHGLIRRVDPGRDAANPFQQATAVTEVRVPRELLQNFAQLPNRRRAADVAAAAGAAARAVSDASPTAAAPAAQPNARSSPAPLAKPAGHLKHRDYQRIMAKFTEAEKTAYSRAWADRHGRMAFDAATTALRPEEQAHIQWQLHLIAQPAGGEAPPQHGGQTGPTAGSAGGAAAPRSALPYAGARRLGSLEAARLRRRIFDTVPANAVAEIFREVLWSIEEGALRRFEPALAANVALKKLREGAWSRPNRMPPNWLRGEVLPQAAPETCVAA